MAGYFQPNRNVEPKNSQIKWENADDEIAQKVAAAINNDSLITRKKNILVPLLALLMLIFPIGFLIYVLFFSIMKMLSDVILFEIVIYLLTITASSFFVGTIIYQCIKAIPYIYPEKQSNIWIFSTKCFRVALSGKSLNEKSTVAPLAFFNSVNGPIRIIIKWNEYKANPVGEEYIFYKFNNRTGNRWCAIQAKKVNEQIKGV